MSRISRGTFTVRMLGLITADFLLYAVLMANGEEQNPAAPIFYFLTLLLTIIKITQVIARLHDINLSGWYVLIGLIPLVNLIGLLLFFEDGTHGENKYGSDPLRRKGEEERNNQGFMSSTESVSRQNKPSKVKKKKVKKPKAKQVDNKMELIEDSFKNGLLTEHEYKTKKRKLEDQQKRLTKQEEFNVKKAKLKTMVENGIIDKKELNSKLRVLSHGLEIDYFSIDELHLNSRVYYISRGKERGVYTVKQILYLMEKDLISPNCLIRHEDESTYNKRAKELLELV